MADQDVYIAGAFEHSLREAPDRSTLQLHAEAAREALADAGLSKSDVDGYFTAGVPAVEPVFPPEVMCDYLGLDVSVADTTDYGGSAYLSHVGHAAALIRDGNCDVALITQGGRPRSAPGEFADDQSWPLPQNTYERLYGSTTIADYALAARRHMHEYGTTREQLAEIRVAAAHHAQYNDDAYLGDPVSVEDVVESRPIAEPLHLLDCCVVTDGGGALVVVSAEVAADLERECVEVMGHGEATGDHDAGRVDVTTTAATASGGRAFAEAGVGPEDVDYASIYDSFTITVLAALEDLGFCEKGEGGSFVEGGTLRAPDGDLPFNTDGGGQCSNQPGNRGGMVRTVEAVRQLRGEANDPVQVDADVAIAHGTGGRLSTRHGAVTLLLGREGR